MTFSIQVIFSVCGEQATVCSLISFQEMCLATHVAIG